MRIAGTVSRVFLSVLMLAALIIANMPSGTNAATGGVQYDQLTRFYLPGSATPLPDNFATNFKAAVDAAVSLNSQPMGHGFFSAITHAASIAKAEQAVMKSGVPMSYYYLNNWERQDDPGKQTATIFRPDRKQIIHLDLAKKTYTIEDMGNRTPPPAVSQPPQTQPQQPEASPEPGTAKTDVSVTSKLLGPKSIDGVPTTGYNLDFKMVTTQATSSCQNGSFETSVDDYVSSIVPPNVMSNDMMKHAYTGIDPSMLVAKGGCAPTITTHKAVGATAPAGHLSLWEIMTIKGSPQGGGGSQGQQQGFSTYLERGNVKILGPGDAGLFDVPAGFTKG